jgi:hypothetical protein
MERTDAMEMEIIEVVVLERLYTVDMTRSDLGSLERFNAVEREGS